MADREAAKHSGKETYARTLMKGGVLDHYLNLPVEENKFDIRSFEKAPTNIYDLIVDNLTIFWSILSATGMI